MDNKLKDALLLATVLIVLTVLAFSVVLAMKIKIEGDCSYENLYTYAQETLYAPDPNMFATQVDYFRAAVQYADNGTWATLENGTQCKLIN